MNPFPISDTLFHALLIIGAVLLAASASVAVLGWRFPQKNWLELRQRVRTWWWIVAVFVLAISVNRTVSLLVLGFVSFLAFKEYLTLVPTRRADHLPLLWAYLAIPIQYFWIWDGWYGMFIIFIPVYAFLFLPMRMVLLGDTQGFLRAASTLHWGLMTTVFSLSHMAYLLVLPSDVTGSMKGDGALLVLFLVALTQFNDVAQYLWGKSLGRIKVIPKVSPNKTVAGFLGGVATTTVLGCLLGPVLTPMSTVHATVAGLLIGVTGFVGDVVMSAVKRDLGVKDSGDLLPGHGGILDRLDSLTYTAPLFFHYLRYLYY
ncbi:phosphatidate cytidylyltransferase [Chitiniphilus shinanonensis]|uniref:Phosphatidate cytidylyltransferase n=1 Tax=Chitiniphilus shinanonensis TaxID=553088 RepID=A0ABQ6BT56_9NEIS|nr:phosphatidate cytidylyltransferase [Chitiniphilus shinanonensis]GLS04684.1 phosphatidate cytidylyltransferase [Chitiniphilus shinanonensis]